MAEGDGAKPNLVFAVECTQEVWDAVWSRRLMISDLDTGEWWQPLMGYGDHDGALDGRSVRVVHLRFDRRIKA